MSARRGPAVIDRAYIEACDCATGKYTPSGYVALGVRLEKIEADVARLERRIDELEARVDVLESRFGVIA